MHSKKVDGFSLKRGGYLELICEGISPIGKELLSSGLSHRSQSTKEKSPNRELILNDVMLESN